MKIFNVSSMVFSSLVNGSTSEYQRDESEAANQLIDTLHFLSPMSSAFKFDQYGCHCFQRGLESSAFTGKGPALDNMDRACLKFHQCQRCLGIDKGKECNHLSTYDIRLVENSVTSQRSAVCQDEPGSCGRNLCECTIAFAKAMKEAEETSPWNIEISKYSSDQTFRAQCQGQGASGVAHHASHGAQTTIPPTTTTSTAEPTTMETTTEMSPINVRARFMDMPKVQLKFGNSARDNENEFQNIPKNLQNASRTTQTETQTETNTDKMTTPKTIIEREEIATDSTTTSSSFEQPIRQELSRTEAQTNGQVTSETNLPSAAQTGARASTVAQTVEQTQTVPRITTTETPIYEEPREMCCGDYSDHRFPYYSLNRGCCNGKTFDTLNLKCCDGVIKSIFSEC